MGNLRKVKFTLEGNEELGLFDYAPEEESEMTTTRNGLFHKWNRNNLGRWKMFRTKYGDSRRGF